MDAFPLRVVPTQIPLENKNTQNEIGANHLAHSLLQVIAKKDENTFQHGNRVAEITAEWIHYMKSKREWIDLDEQDLVLSARLHDVGKVGVLDQVLNKTGPLTPEEKEHLNLHVEIGYELIRDFKNVSSLALAIRHHHERWDGKGYPLGLKRDQIPFFAQIISIVDTYDAITSERPYQKARSSLEAIAEIEKNAGRQFSPALSQSFVEFLYARNS